MVEAFYELARMPFGSGMGAAELYRSHSMEEAASRLKYAAENKWFAVVTGDCGTGKTTAVRRLASTLSKAYKLLYISDSQLTPRNFYKGLLSQMGCEAKFYRGDAKRQLHQEVHLMEASQRVTPVVAVDEAHLLGREMLEEVRFLLNFDMDSRCPMALILVGQPELAEKLGLQPYAAINQRVQIKCRMRRYDRKETEEYICRHLEFAGAGREVFTQRAVDEVYKYSDGVARLINKVCVHSLIYGANSKQRLIDDHAVAFVIEREC